MSESWYTSLRIHTGDGGSIPPASFSFKIPLAIKIPTRLLYHFYMPHPYLFQCPDRQWQTLTEIAHRTDLKIADVLRRSLDHLLQEKLVNEVFPAMSGQILFKLRS